ncbi:MAG: BBP7 family outer membrane beta-barrel protein [Planctomycetota bacterium]|jgi:hypothetical protein
MMSTALPRFHGAIRPRRPASAVLAGLILWGWAAAPARAQEQPVPLPPPGAAAVSGTQVPAVARRSRVTLLVEGGVTVLEDPDGQLGEDVPPAAGAPLDWDDVNHDPALAIRATVGVCLSSKARLELRGTWYGSGDASSRETGVFGFLPGPGISPVNTVTMTDEIDFYGLELNWWRDLELESDDWWLGVGFRYLQCDETATAERWSPGLGVPGVPFIQSDAENAFFGGQLVGEVTEDISSCFEAGLRIGILVGSLSTDARVVDEAIFSGGRHTARNDGSEFTWGFELNAALTYRVSRTFGVVFSYNLLYLDDILRANKAMDFTQANTGAVQARRRTESMLTQMFLIGFELQL